MRHVPRKPALVALGVLALLVLFVSLLAALDSALQAPSASTAASHTGLAGSTDLPSLLARNAPLPPASSPREWLPAVLSTKTDWMWPESPSPSSSSDYPESSVPSAARPGQGAALFATLQQESLVLRQLHHHDTTDGGDSALRLTPDQVPHIPDTPQDPTLARQSLFVTLASIPLDARKAIPPRILSLLPPLPRPLRWSTCAVVGTARSPERLLQRYSLGADIDAHDAVFRVDDDPVRGFEAAVGNRTTMRVLGNHTLAQGILQAVASARRRSSLDADPHAVYLAEWTRSTTTKLQLLLGAPVPSLPSPDPHPYLADVFGPSELPDSPPLPAAEDTLNRRRDRIRRRVRFYSKTGVLASAFCSEFLQGPSSLEFDRYFCDTVSTHLLTILLALSHCQQVNVFGYGDLSALHALLRPNETTPLETLLSITPQESPDLPKYAPSPLPLAMSHSTCVHHHDSRTFDTLIKAHSCPTVEMRLLRSYSAAGRILLLPLDPKGQRIYVQLQKSHALQTLAGWAAPSPQNTLAARNVTASRRLQPPSIIPDHWSSFPQSVTPPLSSVLTKVSPSYQPAQQSLYLFRGELTKREVALLDADAKSNPTTTLAFAVPATPFIPLLGSCALVGSTGWEDAAASNASAVIDGHDVVVRMDWTPAGGRHASTLGSKTTFRFLSVPPLLSHPGRKSENVSAEFSAWERNGGLENEPGSVFLFDTPVSQQHPFASDFDPSALLRASSLLRGSPETSAILKQLQSRRGVHRIRFLGRSASKLNEHHRKNGFASRLWDAVSHECAPTSELSGLAVFLAACESVSVVGFPKPSHVQSPAWFKQPMNAFIPKKGSVDIRLSHCLFADCQAQERHLQSLQNPTGAGPAETILHSVLDLKRLHQQIHSSALSAVNGSIASFRAYKQLKSQVYAWQEEHYTATSESQTPPSFHPSLQSLVSGSSGEPAPQSSTASSRKLLALSSPSSSDDAPAGPVLRPKVNRPCLDLEALDRQQLAVNGFLKVY